MKELHNTPAPELANLLPVDTPLFAMLKRVLRTPCRYIVTNEKNYIVCHSEYPFPVWVWVSDEVPDAELKLAKDLLAKELVAWDTAQSGGEQIHVNVETSFAMRLISELAQTPTPLAIKHRINVYDCPSPKKPVVEIKGSCECGTEEDFHIAHEMMRHFFLESAIDNLPESEQRKKAEVFIFAKRCFFWKNEEGEPVSMALYTDNGDGSESLNNVFTMPQHRRKGYASALVYEVAQMILKKEHMPMLYTDAGYEASNKCYEKLGFTRRGSLCTLVPQAK